MKKQTPNADHDPEAPRISLVIPAYNEEAYLPQLLDTVERARARYHGGAEAIEVVVADNNSTDDTADLARKRGCLVVQVEKRVIAAARNGGARAARGEILAFVDADSQIHPETFNAIDRAFRTNRIVAGATGAKPDRISLGILVTFLLVVPLVWLTGMDIGVVFCRHKDFKTIKGYNEKRLFAEDVQLLLDLKRLGERRGQKLARLTKAKAITSARKFDQYGDWHYPWMILRVVLSTLFSGYSIERFARGYWYRDQQ